MSAMQTCRSGSPVVDHVTLLQRHLVSSGDDDDVIVSRGLSTESPRDQTSTNDRKTKTKQAQHSLRPDTERVDENYGREGDEDELTLAGALEMLPLPCAISGPAGMPTILLVNSPSLISNGGDHQNNDGDVDGSAMATTATASGSGRRGEIIDSSRATVAPGGATVLDRWSVAKLNLFYARYLPTKRRDRSGAWREKKATKTLAIVLGVFLFCWAPFFTINIVNAVCLRKAACESTASSETDNHRAFSVDQLDSSILSGDDDVLGPAHSSASSTPSAAATTSTRCSDACDIDPVVVSSFVWLGYINSALNPIIYTIFNVEFRRAFDRLLRRPCRALMSPRAGDTLRGSTALALGAMTAAAAAAVARAPTRAS